MKITPLDAALGARITDLDLSKTVADGQFERIYAAWLEHAVLIFPNQVLSENRLVAFSARFGRLESPPASESRTRGDGGAVLPEIWNISNVKVSGEAIGSLGNLEAEWHTDMSYLENPPTASILYAREIPDQGGNTSFANMHAALEAMPKELRRRLEGKSVIHDSAYTSVGELRKGATIVADVSDVRGAVHAAIRKHPESGRPVLYMGRRLNASFIDLPTQQSERLLDEVWAFCTQPEFAYEHVWTVGDLVIWDNRSVIHRRDAFDNGERRIMWRTQVKASAGTSQLTA